MKSFNLIFNLLIFSLMVLCTVLLFDVPVKYSKWMMAFLIIALSIMFFIRAVKYDTKEIGKKIMRKMNKMP